MGFDNVLVLTYSVPIRLTDGNTFVKVKAHAIRVLTSLSEFLSGFVDTLGLEPLLLALICKRVARFSSKESREVE